MTAKQAKGIVALARKWGASVQVAGVPQRKREPVSVYALVKVR